MLNKYFSDKWFNNTDLILEISKKDCVCVDWNDMSYWYTKTERDSWIKVYDILEFSEKIIKEKNNINW